MFVTLASLHIFYQLKDFSWIMRSDAIQDQLCEIAPSHNIRSLVKSEMGKSEVSVSTVQMAYVSWKYKCNSCTFCFMYIVAC